jgi:integrase
VAVNLICSKCYKTFKLKTKRCDCGSGSFKYKVRVKLSTGQWLTKQVPTLPLARKVEIKFKTQAIEGDVLGIHKAPLIDSAWDKYLKHVKVNKKSWSDDNTRWELHIRPKLSGLKMDKVTSNQIQSIIDSMISTHSPATRKQVLQLINRIYNWSRHQGYYKGGNPCSGLNIPKFDNKMTESLTESEFRRLIDVLDTEPNERASLIIRYALYSGKRKGEILRLKWEDVDDKMNGTIQVTYRNTKNTETQTLPVNAECMKILDRARELRVSDYVFPCSTGRYYYSFNRTWFRIRKRAGISVRFHDLRHTYASFLISSGKVSLYELQSLLGHKSVHLTQRYAHLLRETHKLRVAK